MSATSALRFIVVAAALVLSACSDPPASASASASAPAPVTATPVAPVAPVALAEPTASSGIANPFGPAHPTVPKAIAADAARDVQVLGSLPKDAIARSIRGQSAHVANCAKLGPSAKGIVVIKFIIGGDGRVTTAQTVESSLGRRDVEDCLLGALKTWAFAKPKGGGIVVVSYPFVLD